MFIDTHTHLFTEAFDQDREQAVQRALDAGVERLLLPNIDVDTIQAMHDMEAKWPDNCFAMMGLHPGSVDQHWESKLAVIKENLFQRDYVAVGEIGMDLYWDTTYINEQREAFRQQVLWAKQLRKPIVIHAREAFNEIFNILDELNDDHLMGVFHCFTGSLEQARHIESYGGFKMGIGGVVTYKKAALDDVLQHVDLNNIVLETDAPYLSPVPYRGKRNESAYVLHVAERLSDIYEVPLQVIEEKTTRNAMKLFALDRV
jgi:TatD DNase family protein